MILDDGVCSVYRKVDKAEKGAMPVWAYELVHQSWYKELDFATGETYPTEYREEVQTDARIRILQERTINNHCVVVMGMDTVMDPNEPYYEITRAYHGRDQESGEMITDLSLRRVEP